MNRQEQSESSSARPGGRAHGSWRGIWLAAAIALPWAFAACGPDGRTLGDTDCPDQPLYRWEYDASTNVWTRVHQEGDSSTPLTQDELDAIKQAEQHCLTPAGGATSIHANDAGTKTPLDASKD